MTDVIDLVLALDPRHALHALRRQRPDNVKHTQGSHDVLLSGPHADERAAAALRVALINGDQALAAHYRNTVPTPLAAAMEADVGLTPRLRAILAHVDRVATAPGQSRPEHLRALEAAGLSAREIVALSQLIAFVSYQARVLAGLRLLQTERAA